VPTLPFLGREPTAPPPSNGRHPLIELQDVHKSYKTAVGDYPALRGVSLRIHAGEFVSVIGKSGSGKTTLINMITGIDRPTSGEVWVNQTPVHTLTEGAMARWRGKNIGVVFQFFQLLPIISVVENVMLPMDFCRSYPLREREPRAMHLLDLVGLADHAYKLPSALSGGQQQRVAIARALANDPPLVIADEPTGNLDSRTAESVFLLFNGLIQQGKTIIIVTHDSGLARRANRTALIADGEIVNEYIARALPTLTPNQLLTATRMLKPMEFEPGAMIISEGRDSEAFYIVSKGIVEVVLPRAGQSDVVALQLGPGKYFGEIEFFHEHRNRASIRAYEGGPVEVLALNYQVLTDLLKQSEPTREALHKAADEHEQENLRKRARK
jgi:ABC-type lipoprotein export system ATPase subunit